MVLAKRVLVLRDPKEKKNKANSAEVLSGLAENVKVVDGVSWASLSDALGESADPSRWRFLCKMGHTVKKDAEFEDFVLLSVTHGGAPEERFALKTHDFDGIVTVNGTWPAALRLLKNNRWAANLPVIQLATKGRERRVLQPGRGKRLSTAGALAVLEGIFTGNAAKVEEVFSAVRTALDPVIEPDADQAKPGNWIRRRRRLDKAERVARKKAKKKVGKKKAAKKQTRLQRKRKEERKRKKLAGSKKEAKREERAGTPKERREARKARKAAREAEKAERAAKLAKKAAKKKALGRRGG